MYAKIVYNAYMKSKQSKKIVQLTIRNVPEQVKKLLAGRARVDGHSLNAVLVEALSSAAGVFPGSTTYTDLDGLAGCWVDDPEFDKAILAQDEVDDEMWR
jgi:acyl CoA:acetate/3-ketoacid CoA transferase alpha subunit